MGCTLCTKNYPGIFEMSYKKAVVKVYDEITIDKEKLQETITACHVKEIEYIEKLLNIYIFYILCYYITINKI